MNENESFPERPQSQPPSRSEVKREVIEFIKMVAWFLVLFFALRTYVIEGYEVQGPSMRPTLEDRERILVFKLPHLLSQFRWLSGIDAVEPGDIVVFESPDDQDKRYVKRVIAKGPKKTPSNTVGAEEHGSPSRPEPGAKVVIEGNTVYVNNQRIHEDYLQADHATTDGDSEEVLLGPGKYYVLGDNREVSKDSRSFGPIEDDTIVGTALLRFWPPNKISILR
ncbi:MAG: signal peptidase I [Candidatus Hydrogenedentes bacterium]|nr:signal peptidase I [Candidatus Hydrogenedentota bacterium]